MLSIGVLCLSGAIAATQPSGQWRVEFLVPPHGIASYAFAVSAGQQAGNVQTADVPTSHGTWGTGRASVWSGSARTWVNLHPRNGVSSECRAVSGNRQAGFVTYGSHFEAALWTGTEATYVNLHPAKSIRSEAHGISAINECGLAVVDGVQRASLWKGTAESWTDLHPAGASASVARSTTGPVQVGSATIGGKLQAGKWTGTKDSWTPLVVKGFATSEATAAFGDEAVGYAGSGSLAHAILWKKGGEFVDLHPKGASHSSALAIDQRYQVGSYGGRACLWSGTAESVVDLHQHLPGAFFISKATGVWSTESQIFVVGVAWNRAVDARPIEAVMWVFER